ncbi:MAG TPA: ATP-dependent DNA ligase [Microlunatus sp.]|nr:ATP-dependent DNA ligase [Microlunatus sp.]
MLLDRLAETWTAVAATRSRNAKRDLLAATLADAGPGDLEIAVSYLAGTLRQRRPGLGWRGLAELPPPATEASLTLSRVDATFEAMAALSGPGSANRRGALAADLFGRATEREQAFLRGLVLGDLRQGAMDALVQEGMARAYGVDPAVVRRAAMLLSSTTEAANLLVAGGAEALAAVGLAVGTPIQPMLAASAPGPEAALTNSGAPAIVDVKLDGIRVQVHRRGDDVRIFTRSLDEITERLPEVVAAVRTIAADELVLDGEVLALRSDGRPEAFQLVASRTATRSTDADRGLTLRVFFFDVLHVDGRTLLDSSLAERAAELERLLPPELRVERTTVATVDELTDVFDSAVARGFEGVVVKQPAAGYSAGRRQASWVKVKPRHTLDLLVIGVEWGYGRRAGWLSNIHLAARDAVTGEPVMLGKTFKGMTDELLRWQTEHFAAIATTRDQHTVHVQPTTVVEIACDGLQKSTRYPGGVALRFARVLRYRPDKKAADADTLDDVKRLLGPPVVAPDEPD